MQFDKLKSFVLDKLGKEIPKNLTYHNVQHTKDVLQNAGNIAGFEEVSGDALTILLTATLLHDTGFLETYKEHELLSCDFAREHLSNFGYTESQINQVCDLIMTTKIPQGATDKLGQILCDADLLYLGTDQYKKKSQLLYKELRNLKLINTYDEWVQYQVNFIEKHTYYTKLATGAYAHKKMQNLSLLQAQARDEKKRKHIHFDMDLIQDLVFIV